MTLWLIWTPHLKALKQPLEMFVVLVSEHFPTDRVINSISLTIRTNVGFNVICLFLGDSHTSTMEPVLTSVTSNVKPEGRPNNTLGTACVHVTAVREKAVINI